MTNKGKKKVVRAVFDRLDELSAEDIVKSEVLKSLLRAQVPISIREAFNAKKIFASVFEINNSGAFVEIHKHQWIPALESIVLWLVDMEDYESCTEIKNLISEIKNKPKDRPIVNVDNKKD